jgi:tetrahydromethanopterin S-methyltransferase subunit G
VGFFYKRDIGILKGTVLNLLITLDHTTTLNH